MDPDTDMGGSQQRFPETRHSAIIAARSNNREERQRAFAAVVESYWKPTYKYIRIKWQATNEDAKDLTQGFFAIALEKNYFATFDSEKASFQTFLRTCLDRFIANQKKAEDRLKRGGGLTHFSLDFSGAEAELDAQQLASSIAPDEFFHREWVRSLFAQAVETLRLRYHEAGRSVHFKLFTLYDLHDDDPERPAISYASLAREFDLKTTDVTNYLAAARKDFRNIVLEHLRLMTASDAEFRNEARSVLGVDAR